jgi:hypothetical protein
LRDKNQRVDKAVIGSSKKQFPALGPDPIFALNGMAIDTFSKTYPELYKEYISLMTSIDGGNATADVKARFNYIQTKRLLNDTEVDSCMRKFVPLFEQAGFPVKVLHQIGIHSSLRSGLVQQVSNNIVSDNRGITNGHMQAVGQWDSFGNRD